MSLVADGLATFIGVLEDANLPVRTDPRNVAPPCLLVEAPSVQSIGLAAVQLTIPVISIAAPPGNSDALNLTITYLDAVLDACADASASTVTAEPGIYSTGGQELPAYNIRVTVAYRKD